MPVEKTKIISGATVIYPNRDDGQISVDGAMRDMTPLEVNHVRQDMVVDARENAINTLDDDSSTFQEVKDALLRLLLEGGVIAVDDHFGVQVLKPRAIVDREPAAVQPAKPAAV